MSNTNNQNKAMVTLMLLSTFYIFFLLLSSVYVNRLISLYQHFFTTAAAFFFPLTFVVSDIIAETYGYKIARILVWTGLIIQFMFAFFAYIILGIPDPAFSHTVVAYRVVLHNLLFIYFVALIAAFVSDFINIYALTRLKIFMQGRYFILRSISCNLVGNLIYTTIACAAIYHSQMSTENIFEIGFFIYFIKIIYAGLFAIPAGCIAIIIKDKVKMDIYDYATNFNPFKLDD